MSDVAGLDEVLKKLKKLPDRVQKNVVTGAIRASAKPLIKEARALAPLKSEQTETDKVPPCDVRKSIGVTKKKTRDKSIVWFQVSARKTGGANDGWCAHFYEYGTYAFLDHAPKRHKSGRLADRRNRLVASGFGIRPYAFMRKAYEREGENTIKAAKAYMIKRIDKEIAKL